MTQRDALNRRRLIVGAAAISCAALVRPGRAGAHSYTSETMMVGHIWSPPGSGDAAPVYGPIINRGDETDRLVSLSSPDAARVRIRRAEEGSEPVFLETLDLPPNRPVSLAPWGVHLWAEGLTVPREEGARFRIRLGFARAAPMEVEAIVESEAGH